MTKKRKVMVGLSGGVDSAVAAWILKEQGYDVTCAFMRNWDSLTNDDILGNPTLNDDICSQEQDWADAKAAADKLGLPLLRVDFVQEYWTEVFRRFLDDYRKGRTPNPDILCNRYIKFDSFLKFRDENGFDTVATGHYAKMVKMDGHNIIAKADDRNKDQSYFLAQVKKEVLDDVLFPLGSIDKLEVRRIAHELDLNVAEKKDSTGICFIGERQFRQFLSNYLPMKSGRIVNLPTHETVGEHKGVLYYTIGQRKGLDIGGTGPYFVIGKDVQENILYVTDAAHQDLLYSDSCLVTGVNLLSSRMIEGDLCAKFRYRQNDNPVSVKVLDENSVLVSYPQTVRSVTPGQQAVFYDGDIMLGGGTIDAVYRNGQDLMNCIITEGKK